MEYSAAPSGISVGSGIHPVLAVQIINIRVRVLSRKYRVVSNLRCLQGPGLCAVPKGQGYFRVLAEIYFRAVFKGLAVHFNFCGGSQSAEFHRYSGKIRVLPYIGSDDFILRIQAGSHCRMVVCSHGIGRILRNGADHCLLQKSYIFILQSRAYDLLFAEGPVVYTDIVKASVEIRIVIEGFSQIRNHSRSKVGGGDSRIFVFGKQQAVHVQLHIGAVNDHINPLPGSGDCSASLHFPLVLPAGRGDGVADLGSSDTQEIIAVIVLAVCKGKEVSGTQVGFHIHRNCHGVPAVKEACGELSVGSAASVQLQHVAALLLIVHYFGVSIHGAVVLHIVSGAGILDHAVLYILKGILKDGIFCLFFRLFRFLALFAVGCQQSFLLCLRKSHNCSVAESAVHKAGCGRFCKGSR